MVRFAYRMLTEPSKRALWAFAYKFGWKGSRFLAARRRDLGAADSSGRGSMAEELAAMQPCCSHDLAGREVPERHWGYRLAKKFWFFGFGAYG